MSKQNIYNTLMQDIKNAYGVCGLMGNIQAESNFTANNAQNSYMQKIVMTDAEYTRKVDAGTYTDFTTDRIGYGLCQWTSSGRKAGLLAFAKASGKSIGDENMQLSWLLKELKESYGVVYSALKTATSVKQASDIVVTKFERPADQSTSALAKRQSFGETIYKEFANNMSSTSNVQLPSSAANCPIIAIDAGHGKNTAGKRCLESIDTNQTREWFLNNRVASYLVSMLAEYDCNVVTCYDLSGVSDTPLQDRCNTANAANADIFLSIHHNAGINGRNGGGVVVYYYSSDENRYNQAQNLYNSVVSENGLVGNRSQKVIKNGFYVLKHTKAPAFLLENGFMDSQDDTPVILTEGFAIQTAKGMLNWLVNELSLKKLSNSSASANGVSSSESTSGETADSSDSGLSLPKNLEEVAKEVIAGKWGNGSERKKRLEQAGYVYEVVQKKVNELLKPASVPKQKLTLEEVAIQVIKGQWGNGEERKKRLQDAGYSYSDVQHLVNIILDD